jgi:type IV pilus assembly protein PilA
MTDMVVGAMICCVVMAISLCTFTSASTTSATIHCHDNMEVIANLEDEYKVNSAAHLYTTTMSALNTEVPTMPLCPDGGTYSVTISTGTSTAQNGQTVPAGKIVISCSNPTHGKYAPDIDTP